MVPLGGGAVTGGGAGGADGGFQNALGGEGRGAGYIQLVGGRPTNRT